jgi:hypothetical protein
VSLCNLQYQPGWIANAKKLDLMCDQTRLCISSSYQKLKKKCFRRIQKLEKHIICAFQIDHCNKNVRMTCDLDVFGSISWHPVSVFSALYSANNISDFHIFRPEYH